MDLNEIFEILDFPIDFPKETKQEPSCYLDSFAEPKDIKRRDADFEIVNEMSILDI